jgi:hypothetical protein
MWFDKTVIIYKFIEKMRRGNNNVFKVSGNLALGGGNDYMGG